MYNGSVLVVDEDVNARIIAETLLRLRGLQVRSAADRAEAGALTGEQAVDVVLLDVNGLEMLAHLRRMAPATRPRVVVMAERPAADSERFALRAGADAYLRKPMAPSELIRTVERLIEARRPQRVVAGAS